MSRPIGSKNKPKTAVMPSAPRDDTLTNSVPFVLDSIEPQDVSECSSSRAEGTCAESTTVEGWANLCASHFTVLGKKMDGYYLGGDIHKTIEDAKKLAGTTAVGQVYIRWCDTRKAKVIKDDSTTPSTPEE